MKKVIKKWAFVFLLIFAYPVISFPDIKIKETLTIGDNGEGILFQWVGLTTDDRNNIYVTDLKDYSLKKYNAKGEFIKKTGRRGQGPGEFLSPGFIRFYNENIYVGQIQHPGIQVFDTELNYKKTIPLKLLLSCFQIIDENLLAVSTLMSRKIQLYDFEGEMIGSVQYAQDEDYMLNEVDFIVNDECFYLCFKWQDILCKLSLNGDKLWERNIFKLKKVKTKKIGNFVLPQDVCFKTITFDKDKKYLFVLGGNLAKNKSRDVYILSKEGTLVDTITLPEPSHMIHIDSENFLYSRSEYGTLIKKFQIIFNE